MKKKKKKIHKDLQSFEPLSLKVSWMTLALLK